MKKAKKMLVAIAFMAVAGLIFLVYAEESLSLDKLPPEVRQTIEKYAEGAKINEIELEKNKEGKEIYEIEILKDGKEIDFMVATDGQFIGFEEEDEDEEEDEEIEREIELAQAPQAVQDAILKIAGDNPIIKVEEEIDDGVATYEAEYTVAGVEHSVECTATGEILELEHQVEANALPAAILKEIAEEYPGAVIKDAEAVQVFFYEIEIEINGKKQEIKISATGDLDDDDDDHDDDDDDDDDEGEDDDD